MPPPRTERQSSASLLMFSFNYPPDEGGISRMCSEIAQRRAPHGNFDVLTMKLNNRGTPIDIPDGIEVDRVAAHRPKRELAGWWAMVRRNRRRPVLVGTWYPEGLIALLAGHRQLVILAHGAELTPPEQRWRRPVWALLRRLTLERANVVIANSHFTAGFVRRVAPGANAVAVPLAVDHERFTPGDITEARKKFGVSDPDTRVVCTVSRIQAFKGIDVVLHAIASLPVEQRKRLVYLVGGLGPARSSLQELARALGIESNVRWIGYVPEADLAEFYRAGDLFALCTREQIEQRHVEGFGLVFLEAQACGTPVVGTRTGGIPDAITEGEGGWLIEQDDVGAVTTILSEVIAHPERFDEQGRLGRARVEREGTWDHYMERFEAAIGTGMAHG